MGVDGSGETATATFLATAPALQPFVTAYYVIDVRDGPVEDVLHPEWGNLRFLIEGEDDWQAADEADVLATQARVALFGATSRARRVRAGQGRCLGVGMTPLGWAMLIGSDAAATADRVVTAADVLGPDVEALHRALVAAADDGARARLLDAYLLARASDATPPRADVARLTALLADPVIATVDELAEASGMTPVTLARTCLRHFGFTPKVLLRRQRFLRTLAVVLETGGRLSDALDPHYTDQPHFNRDFRAFMGETPMRYFGRAHPIVDAAARARRAALGASVQVLHVRAGAESDPYNRDGGGIG